ncbi:MAG: hypothetical protein IAE95_07335 [Chitinophagaceae bacterium]|nr:hypothetical protein [Chitinophagaceae bacterium]
MEHGITNGDKQRYAARETDGLNRIIELTGQFLKLRNTGLIISGIGLSSVFRFVRVGGKAVFPKGEKVQSGVRQHNDEDLISGRGKTNGLNIGSSDIGTRKPEMYIQQMPVSFEQNSLRSQIVSGRRHLFQVLKSELPSKRLTNLNSHDEKGPDEYRQQPAREAKEGQSFTGDVAAGHRSKNIRPIKHQMLSVAPLFAGQRTIVRKEKTKGIGPLGKEVGSKFVYDLRTPRNLEKSRSNGVQRLSQIGMVPSPGMLQSGYKPAVESLKISRKYLAQSVRPLSLGAEMPMGGKLLSDDRQPEQTLFDFPAANAGGKVRRGRDGNADQRNHSVKVEINHPLIGSLTIQNSRGDGGVYELRSKIEGVLLDILESVNTIG